MNNLKLIGVFALSFLTLVSCNRKVGSDVNNTNNTNNSVVGEPVICTASLEPALNIQVFDKASGLQASCGASAVISEGDFSEVLSIESSNDCDNESMLIGAYERAGKYNIKVSKRGYADFYFKDVTVGANECHVNTKTLKAYMEKS